MDRPRRAFATPGNGIEATVLPEVNLGGYVRFWYCGTLCSGGAMRNGVITRDGLIKIKKDMYVAVKLCDNDNMNKESKVDRDHDEPIFVPI